jgi:hypothetical protein
MAPEPTPEWEAQPKVGVKVRPAIRIEAVE